MTTRSDDAPVKSARSGAADREGAVHLPRLVAHFVLVTSCVSGVAAAFGGSGAALSGALGVLLAGINLLLLRRIMAALAVAEGASAAWAIVLPFKLVGLVAAAFALVEFGVAQPVPLAIGFGLLPLTGVFLPRASSVPGVIVSNRPAPPGQALKS
jgi:hypothetical protein